MQLINQKKIYLNTEYTSKKSTGGKGLAIEASKSIIDHAFKNLTVTALFAGHNPNNRVSKKLYSNSALNILMTSFIKQQLDIILHIFL